MFYTWFYVVPKDDSGQLNFEDIWQLEETKEEEAQSLSINHFGPLKHLIQIVMTLVMCINYKWINLRN